MKKLSKWGKRNPKSSRIIIAISHLLVLLNAVFFGTLLFIINWGTSKWLLAVAANLFFIAYIFYPKKSKKKKQFSNFYLRQKTYDFSLVVFYSVVIAFGVNNFLIKNSNINNSALQPAATFIAHKPKSENKITKQIKPKEIRKQIKHDLRRLKKELKSQKNKGGEKNLKIFLTLLTIGIAVLLGYLIAGLSCSLSCFGQGGLAGVVLLVGWIGTAWLGIIAIDHIWKKMGKKKKTPNFIEKD